MALQRSTHVMKAALLTPANLFSMVAAAFASWAVSSAIPLVAALLGSAVYVLFVFFAPRAKRAGQVRLTAHGTAQSQALGEMAQLLRGLPPSQVQHFESLQTLRHRITEAYGKMPGGRVLVAASEQRLDGLLICFLRLVVTLNAYRNYLNSADRKAIELELAQLENELVGEVDARLKQVKSRRVEILKKRLSRFLTAEESREFISHQLASIEDLLRLTHEQCMTVRDPESVSQLIESFSSELGSTEETIRELEQFMQVTQLPLLDPASTTEATGVATR